MRYLIPYFKKYKLESILAPLFKMLEATFDLLVPLVVARMINEGIPSGSTMSLVWDFALLLAMALLGMGCSFTAQYFAAKAAIGTAAGLRHQLLDHIQGLDFSTVDKIGGSTLITRMTSDINQVQNGLNMFLRLFLRSPFIVFGSMIMAFTINTEIALIFVAAIAVLFAIVFGIMAITSPMYKRVQRNLDDVTEVTLENLNGVRVIRAFGREESQREKFHKINAMLLKAQLKVSRIAALMNPLTYVIVNGAIILILWFGSNKVNGGTLLSGDIVALINYINQILVELVKLADLVVVIGKAIASMGRVGQILDTKSAMLLDGTSMGCDTAEAVKFDAAGIRYSGGGEEALLDITFTVLKGQTVGVIGGTGSGKSSLINLIPRFYDATSGSVQVLGEDVKNWDIAALRRKVAVVAQKAQLFTGTIRSNLLWGDENATDRQLWDALETAQAADFVREKPNGLDEPVVQGGRNLSGGQRQRLTIARALVSKAEVLILDDSSSALDYATDAALRHAIKKLPGDMTVFIVSQRTSSIQHADIILVLDDGRLAGVGRHEELLEHCQVYREIYESQYKKEASA